MATLQGILETLPSLSGSETFIIPIVNATSTLDASSTALAALNSAGGCNIAKQIRIGGQSTLGDQVNLPNNMYTYTAALAAGNTFRIRNTDASKTATITSLANTGVSATTSYQSIMSLFSLGNTETNNVNVEAMQIGCSVNGGVVAPYATGTGDATKPLNIYGTTMVNNGLVTFPQNLKMNGGTFSIANTNLISSATTAYNFTLPPGVPSMPGMYLTSSTAGVSTWAFDDPIIFTGDGTSVAPSQVSGGNIIKVLFLTQTLNNTNGQLTFFLTSTGTSSGTAFFTTILGVFASGRPANASTNPRTAVIGTEASRTANSVVCNYVTSQASGIVVGGTANGLQAAPQNSICYCMVWGY